MGLIKTMENNLELVFGTWMGFKYIRRNPRNTLVRGHGINDSPFVVSQTEEKGRRSFHPAYATWDNLLYRSFSPAYKEKKKTYAKVTCCKEWLTFTTFAKWFKNNYIEGYHLDKDLLTKDNKLYSPDTCIFIPQEINNFIITPIDHTYPIGVSLKNARFQATISQNSRKKFLGYFNTPEEAHRAWQKAKLKQALDFNFVPLQRVIDQLKFDIENNLETTSL